MEPYIERLLRAWNPSWGFYRLTPRGNFFRTLWAGPLMMAIVFVAFYIPMRRVGLPIFWPLGTVAILVFPWLQQLQGTRTLWKESETTAACDDQGEPPEPSDQAE